MVMAWVLEDGSEASKKLAEQSSAPVCGNYQLNDALPGRNPLYAGPLGYNGTKASMELMAQADVVLALGTRLNLFSTPPVYNIALMLARKSGIHGAHSGNPPCICEACSL